jgi:hypothetical protein
VSILSLIPGSTTIVAIATGVAIVGAGAVGYQKGKASQKAHYELVISNLRLEAEHKLAEANAANKSLSDTMQATKEKAEHEIQAQRQRTERRVADAVATDRLVRDTVAAVASGPDPRDDSIAACRSDARSLGDVLDRVLPGYAVCTGAAEREADGARGLLAAWPRSPSVSAPVK